MKVSKAEVRSSTFTIPQLRFEDQALTSFAGLVLFQPLFQRLGLKERLRSCVRHLRSSASYRPETMLLLLIVHLILGWRRLHDLVYYQGDPLIQRILGLRRLPQPSTMTRFLRNADEGVVVRVRDVNEDLVRTRLLSLELATITLDFDGSVLSSKSRRTEGTAIGYNRKSRGQRSYYPLFATVAQTTQIFDVLHRPGNVHDSRGAKSFILACFGKLRKAGFRGRLEARMDGAHFSDETCFSLLEAGIEFSISVPFERLPELKAEIENRSRWSRIDKEWSFFELRWLPKKWRGRRGAGKLRLVVFRHRVKKPQQGPLQLDLFQPLDHEYEYKAVVTTKSCRGRALLTFHNGRGSQEGIFAEGKTDSQLDYLPTRRLVGNQIYLLCGILAHNLTRELQMQSCPPLRGATLARACLWVFQRVGSFRRRLVQRAGRLTRPSGILTLTLSANQETARKMTDILAALEQAA